MKLSPSEAGNLMRQWDKIEGPPAWSIARLRALRLNIRCLIDCDAEADNVNATWREVRKGEPCPSP